MPNLSSEQTTALSQYLLTVNQSIEDFRFDSGASLTDAQKKALDDSCRKISDYGQQLLALSTTLVMDEVADSLSKIKSITEEIGASIKTLKNVQKGIDVAAALVKLAAAIISENPQLIGTSIAGVVSVWKTDFS